MGDTSIEWADRVWNPTVGCSVLTPGCTNCYAMRMAARIERMGTAGPAYFGLTQPSKAGPVWTGTVRINPNTLAAPLRWRKPQRIFVNSMSDLFHEALSTKDINRVIDVTREAPQHTYMILTKRAQRMREFAEWWCIQHAESRLPSNLWFGVSTEDQARAEERIPHLLTTPAAVRFISAEPLLGPIDLGAVVRSAIISGALFPDGKTHPIDLVIVGGESGPHSRNHDLAWSRSLLGQCQRAGVAYFQKQLGARPVGQWLPDVDMWPPEPPGYWYQSSKGGNPAEWPEDLRVRELPRIAA